MGVRYTMVSPQQIFRVSFLWLLSLLAFHAYPQNRGCTDPLANNYDQEAVVNDGSCTYDEASVNVTRSWNLPPEIDESSGLIIWNGLIWTHNDDTDINLYALDTSNIFNYKAFELTGTVNTDWEEISHDEQYVYVGDFGNNNGNRTDLHILRVEKKSLLAGNPAIDTIWFSYSLQTNFDSPGSTNTDFDCEAFVVTADSIFLFTKEWVSQGSSIYALPNKPGRYVAEFRAKHSVQGLITGSAFLPGRNLVVLSGYSMLLQPFVYLLYDFGGHDFFGGNKRKVILNLPLHQVEGIATSDGLTYFVSNERFVRSFVTVPQRLHQLDLSGFLGEYIQSLPEADKPSGEKSILVFANPASDTITMRDTSIHGLVSYAVFNQAGQLVADGTFTGMAVVATGHLASGLYLIRFEKEGMLEQEKIVIR